MKKANVIVRILMLGIIMFSLASVQAAEPVSHWEFQAVNSDGSSSFDDTDPPERVVLEGIILNNPEIWLDPTADSTLAGWFMGGQWELYIQGEGDDHAGTACWMGQNYFNGPSDDPCDNYTNEKWISELKRLNYDNQTGYLLRAGDRVRVTGKFLFFNGKLNINENHSADDANNFQIELLEPAVGLPKAEVVDMNDLMDKDSNFYFDVNRGCDQNGLRDYNVPATCEYYQGRLVRINDVNIVNSEYWDIGGGEYEYMAVRDSSGREMPIRLGRGYGIAMYDCPAGQIDVIGIMDQKSSDGTSGYRLLVLDYDGSELVLGRYGTRRGNLAGDINGDFQVDLNDLAYISMNWIKSVDGLYNGN